MILVLLVIIFIAVPALLVMQYKLEGNLSFDWFLGTDTETDISVDIDTAETTEPDSTEEPDSTDVPGNTQAPDNTDDSDESTDSEETDKPQGIINAGANTETGWGAIIRPR